MTTTSSGSAFAEVNELVAQAGSVLNLKKGLVDAINAIDEEVRNLENSQALDLLNKDISIGFISTSIPVFIFTVTAIAAIYAYLARRKRRSKFDLASNEMLAKIIEQQSALAVKKKNVEVSKTGIADTKKKT